MNYVGQYHQNIKSTLDQMMEKQASVLEESARLMVDTIQAGNSLYLFGASHAGIFTEDAFYRAGGMALFNPIFSPSLMLNVRPVTTTSKMERLEGQGHILLDSKPVQKGDVLFIHSVSGRNPVAIDMALAAQEKEMKVLALTNLSYSKSVESRHSTGKRLFEVSDFIIDNLGEPGDASVSIDSIPQKAAPTSTITGSFVIHSIVLYMISIMEERGLDIPIFRSANIDGGDEYNKEMMEKHADQIHYL
ncbi:SIS domain-containing protein [Pontibacillus salicampi]|uniref:SIS domain-containing protein n=1 Tax=Pontibacillus salicampi TaxID=1449801 RepID=A0ABV6LRB6_9BACI